MTLGTSLRTLRQLRGLSLNELATRLSSHVGNLSKIERDLAKPSLDFLYQIAKALDFKLHEIFRLAERDDSPDERQAALDAVAPGGPHSGNLRRLWPDRNRGPRWPWRCG